MNEAITIDSTVAEIPAQSANEHADEHWDLVIQPKRHLLDINFKELWDYRDLLYMFVHRDIVTVYKQTILGPIWFFVQPIMTTIIYLFVFGTIAKISTDGIPGILFYLSGIVMWNYFAESFNRTSSTFVGNAGIFGKVYFPRLIVPLSLVASGLIKFLIQFTLFLAAFVYYLNTTDAIHPNAWLLATPYLILLMAGLGLGFGIIFSSLTTKYRDLTFLIQFGVQLAMYATPIIYPMSILGPRARAILWWNPIAHLIETMKYGFLGAGDVSVAGLAYATLFTVIVLGAGIVIFNRTEQSFMDTV
ncbi:ABC transporter permease [Rubinisphaera sp. JC750]|uniref:ABC transporter permease n=1 Tax=Rubinisphaera sp. JC750 TaxID=2898658 RepID=UPI001F25E058|nr:ABC transporter permease [Rubinisphaera sp. JC750]